MLILSLCVAVMLLVLKTKTTNHNILYGVPQGLVLHTNPLSRKRQRYTSADTASHYTDVRIGVSQVYLFLYCCDQDEVDKLSACTLRHYCTEHMRTTARSVSYMPSQYGHHNHKSQISQIYHDKFRFSICV